jgi:hypothetical protein
LRQGRARDSLAADNLDPRSRRGTLRCDGRGEALRSSVHRRCELSAGAAWFIDGAYVFKVWQSSRRADKVDYLKLRTYLEATFDARIEDAYYFSPIPIPRRRR